MSDEWSFKEPKNTIVFTTKRVIYRRFPVLQVVHDEDGTWRFLDGAPVDREDAALVSLEYLVNREPDLRDVADLPTGWRATRAAIGQPWERSTL